MAQLIVPPYGDAIRTPYLKAHVITLAHMEPERP